MWDRIQYKADARQRFTANYWPCMLVCLILTVLTGDGIVVQVRNGMEQFIQLSNSMGWGNLQEPFLTVYRYLNYFTLYALHIGLVGILITLLVGNPFQVGAGRFFLENRHSPAPMNRCLFGYNSGHFGNVVLTQFLRSLFIFLWSLLLIIPGIVRSYGYFAVPYILAENPGLDSQRALKLSLDMTRGHKADIFWTHLSFIGWIFLSLLTLNILNIFYVAPYLQATNAEMYAVLRDEALQKGISSPDELPGVGLASDPTVGL